MMRRCPPVSATPTHMLRICVNPPVSATPTAFAPQIGQFPTGEGWRKSLLSSAQALDSRPPCTFSGRADNACTNLLGSLARYVRTCGIVEVAESAKLPTCTISPLPHALATHGSCD